MFGPACKRLERVEEGPGLFQGQCYRRNKSYGDGDHLLRNGLVDPSMAFGFFFFSPFFGHPTAYGVSGPEIRSEPQLRSMPHLR